MPLSVILPTVVFVATPDGETPPATLKLAFVVKVPCPVTDTAACTDEYPAEESVEEELVDSFPATFTDPLVDRVDGPVSIPTPVGMDVPFADSVAEEDRLRPPF